MPVCISVRERMKGCASSVLERRWWHRNQSACRCQCRRSVDVYTLLKCLIISVEKQKVQSADTFYIIKNMACTERVQTSAHARLHLVQMGHDTTITNTFTSCLRDYSALLIPWTCQCLYYCFLLNSSIKSFTIYVSLIRCKPSSLS